MPEIKGVSIDEVWDYRLSNATPLIDRRGGTWVVQIWAKDNPDYDPSDPATLAKPLVEHDTGLKAEHGDQFDAAKIAVCYEWLLTVRDQYSRDDIEELKPLVAQINSVNAALAERGAV